MLSNKPNTETFRLRCGQEEAKQRLEQLKLEADEDFLEASITGKDPYWEVSVTYKPQPEGSAHWMVGHLLNSYYDNLTSTLEKIHSEVASGYLSQVQFVRLMKKVIESTPTGPF